MENFSSKFPLLSPTFTTDPDPEPQGLSVRVHVQQGLNVDGKSMRKNVLGLMCTKIKYTVFTLA
jgi:hypothetical protein